MPGQIIDGKYVAELVKERVKDDVDSWVAKGNRPPYLQVLLVGDDPASKVYIGAKTRACEAVGIETGTKTLPDTVSARELKSVIQEFNEDERIDGILVQLPLPAHLSQLDVIETINFRKDVDGFHPMNAGRLAIGQPCFKPCTPAGIMELFKHYSIHTKSKHAVVVGASQIVGTPMGIMLSRESGDYAKATTTVCHKFTRDLTLHTINADILVVAAGHPHLIKPEMIKEGAVIIDVGINRVADETSEKGYKLQGDVEFESVREKASWITPVPGGVGPMTVAMLMKNTLLAAKKSIYPE